MKKQLIAFISPLLWLYPFVVCAYDFSIICPLRDIIACSDLILETTPGIEGSSQRGDYLPVRVLNGVIPDTFQLDGMPVRASEKEVLRGGVARRFIFIREGEDRTWLVQRYAPGAKLSIASNTCYTIQAKDVAAFRRWIEDWLRLTNGDHAAQLALLLDGLESTVDYIQQDAVTTLVRLPWHGQEQPVLFRPSLNIYQEPLPVLKGCELDLAEMDPALQERLFAIARKQSPDQWKMPNMLALLGMPDMAPALLASLEEKLPGIDPLISRTMEHFQGTESPEWDTVEVLLINAWLHASWAWHAPDVSVEEKARATRMMLYLLELNRRYELYNVGYGMLLEGGNSLIYELNALVPGAENRAVEESSLFAQNWTDKSQRSGVSVGEMNRQCLALFRQIGTALAFCEDPFIHPLIAGTSWELCEN